MKMIHFDIWQNKYNYVKFKNKIKKKNEDENALNKKRHLQNDFRVKSDSLWSYVVL